MKSMPSLLLSALAMLAAATVDARPPAATYRNPLPVRLPDGTRVESCADPTVLRGQRPRDPAWLMVCTQDPLHDRDREADGRLRFHPLPTFVSPDLVHWTYVGDALPAPPPQAAPRAGLWAPELAWVDGRYRLYYTITDVVDALSPEPGCTSDSAIGAASSDSPLGPWVPEPGLVVPPRRAGPGCNFHWTFDPDLVSLPDGRRLLFHGSYGGGLWVQPLDRAALRPQGPAVQVSRSHRYEGAEVVQHGGWWWLFASSSDCCNGALTGYGVSVGRARDPLGPYVDRDGHGLLDARVGGTPVLLQNGNRWVGPGHNSVFTDDLGRWWTAYHAMDRDRAQWTGSRLTRRALLIDPITWVDGWPQVMGGPSDDTRPAPSQRVPQAVRPAPPVEALRGPLLWRDDFRGPALDPRWQWLRTPAVPERLEDGGLRLATGPGDLHHDTNDAAVLLTALPPADDLWIEAEVVLDLPADGDLGKPLQAGLVLYGDDDRYVKLVHIALHDTRQVEFAIEQPKTDALTPRYGSGVVGPPGDRTRLALRVRRLADGVAVTAFSRAGADRWVQGGTWLHRTLGPAPRLGLVAMAGAGYPARFGGVEVRRVAGPPAAR